MSETKIQATCQSDGEVVSKCKICGETKTEVVKASAENHIFVQNTIVKEAKINQTGIAVYVCKICGETDTRSIPALECTHDEENPESAGSLFKLYYTDPASCTETGEKRYRCTNEDCGKEITVIIPMTEHVSNTEEGKGYITVGAVKCVSDGSEEVVCKNCKQTFTRTISAHNYEVKREIAATCTEATQVVSKCKDCGTEKTEVKVDENGVKAEPNGHELTTNIEKAATCVAEGKLTRVCEVCGYTEKKTLPALGHDETEAKYYSATVNANGEITLVTELTGSNKYVPGTTSCEYYIVKVTECQRLSALCNLEVVNGKREIKTVIAEKKAHSIDTSKPVVTGIFECDDEGSIKLNYDSNNKVVGLTNATVDCTHAEAQVFTCATCKKVEQYNIITPKTEHTKVAGTEKTVAPTCDAPGYTTYSCSTCHKTVKDTVIKQLVHDYNYVAETCTERAMIVCSLCKNELKYVEGADNTKYNSICAEEVKSGNTTIKYDEATKTYTLPGFLGHDFTGSDTKTENGKTYAHCKVCKKDIVIVELSVNKDVVEKKAKATNSSDKDKAKEDKVNDRMDLVGIEYKDNTVTIKTNSTTDPKTVAFSKNPEDNCFAIMLDLGIKATDVKITSGNYLFNPTGIDQNYEGLKRWGATSENCFMIWLAPEDFENGDISITFVDSSKPNSYPITITFVYDTTSLTA